MPEKYANALLKRAQAGNQKEYEDALSQIEGLIEKGTIQEIEFYDSAISKGKHFPRERGFDENGDAFGSGTRFQYANGKAFFQIRRSTRFRGGRANPSISSGHFFSLATRLSFSTGQSRRTSFY